MNIGSIFFSGIVGTAVMTGFVYLVAYLTQKRLQVVHILGTMTMGETTADKGLSQSRSAYVAGLLLHYTIGIGWSALYVLIWRPYIPLLGGSALVYGIVIGLISAIAWRLFIYFHPNPPFLPLKSYLFWIGVGHILFSIGMKSLLWYGFDHT